LPKLCLSKRAVAETVVACFGGVLVACALAANQQWLDRHFLPNFFWSRHAYVLLESVIRIAIGALGAVLALIARRPVGHFVAHSPGRAIPIVVAVVMAFGVSELILRQVRLRAAMEEPPLIEPSRRRDARLGWVFVPSRTGRHNIGGRVVEYAIDSEGYRVRRVDEPVDPERPTILFTGESIMVGEGLAWDETIPAQVAEMMGVQSANLAVSGFSSDQAYLRLQTELPRFRRPVAVVALFAPGIFDRNLNHDRPHIGPGLVWLPTEPGWRLTTIAGFLVPYRSKETIERGIAVAREVLLATVALARSRGAVPLIVVPQFVPEEPVEHELRRRILDETGLPYVWVELDPTWRVPGDGHPDPRAAHKIAAAIAARLAEANAVSRPGSLPVSLVARDAGSPLRTAIGCSGPGSRRRTHGPEGQATAAGDAAPQAKRPKKRSCV
jgi:hypothetical protein